ncbi:MAG: hypothetical protein U0441_36450 [Polyangiaceae bacterium]
MRWSVGAMVVSGVMALAGCELIASVPPPDEPIGGGTATGGGGTSGAGGTTAGGSGASGTTTDGCMSDADCPPAADECKVAKCDTSTGMCSDQNVADGTDATTQTDKDCKKNVCMGGAVTAVADATDVLDDGNACTDDSCDANNEPVSAPSAAGTACSAGGTLCDGAGACVECLMDTDCTDMAKPVCQQNACVPATCMDGKKNGDETAPDCGGSCGPCDDLLACKVDGDCKSDVCTGMVCQVPTCGDGKKNGSETDIDCGATCGANKLCGANKGCDADADCKGNQCTGASGTCVPTCSDGEKNNVETDVDCGGGTCGACPVGKQCGASDNNCVGTAYCDAGTCAAKKNNGTGCVGANECSSGSCADSVCCNSACGPTCFACVGAKTGQPTGTCAAITVNTDPDNECAGTNVCDGSGACGKAQGAACAAGSECVSGNCVDGFCCNNACSGTCKACSAAKTGGANGACANVTNNTDPDSECPGAVTCNGSGACASLLADGSACTVNGECANNHCTDSFCCNTTCTGLCQACTAAKKGSGSNGTCGPIASHTDPDNECAGTLTCDGGGGCLKAQGVACGGNAECQTGFCVDGVCCGNVCNGTCQTCNAAGSVGTCSAIPAGSDPANECNGAAPADLCNGGSGCGLGASGAACVPNAVGVCAGPVDCPAGGICP